MALKNYILQTDLLGFVPELTQYLWTGDSDYADEKLSAEKVVRADLVDKGYEVRLLRPELELDTADENENPETFNRNRVVVTTTAFTTTAVVTVTGANDIEDTFVTAGVSSSITGTGVSTFLLTSEYKYYKYSKTGTATMTVVLVESDNYDLLYSYKWLEIILMNKVVQTDDQFHLKAKEFAGRYKDRWNSFQPYYDEDDDGEISSLEKKSGKTLTIQH